MRALATRPGQSMGDGRRRRRRTSGATASARQDATSLRCADTHHTHGGRQDVPCLAQEAPARSSAHSPALIALHIS
jgi:hypothetical protein